MRSSVLPCLFQMISLTGNFCSYGNWQETSRNLLHISTRVLNHLILLYEPPVARFFYLLVISVCIYQRLVRMTSSQNWTFGIIRFCGYLPSKSLFNEIMLSNEGSDIYNKVISLVWKCSSNIEISLKNPASHIKEGSGSIFTEWLGHAAMLQSRMKPCLWPVSLSLGLILTSKTL